MQDSSLDGLRIGCVPYLNARPLVWGIEDRVTFEVPSLLADRFAAGEYDVALLPVFEAFRQPKAAIVEGVSISCVGAVRSVILAHCEPLESLSTIALDPSSRTSSNLLRILLAERYHIAPRFTIRPDEPGGTGVPPMFGGMLPSAMPCAQTGGTPVPLASEATEPLGARLIIGDPALDFQNKRPPGWHILDLGQSWHEWTGLPFVFAVWTLRAGLRDSDAVAEALRTTAAAGCSARREIAASEPDPAAALDYLTTNIRYGLGEREKLAMARFRGLLEIHGLLPPTP